MKIKNTYESEEDELSLSEKGLYEFGELFIPAKNAHSSSDKFCTDLLK